MKRITNFLGRQFVLVTLCAGLSCVVVQAQGQKKPATQPVATQTVPPAPTTTQNTPQQTEQNRPRPLPSLVNPRVQAIVLDQFLPRIALTPEQTNKVRQLRVQHIRKMRTLLELERAQTKLYDDALFDPTVDQKEIEKRTSQLADARTDLLKAQAQFFLDLRQVLSTEQITKLRELMEEAQAMKKNAP